MILSDIFKSYFEKDVRTLADFKDINKLRDTILLLTGRAGSKLEISKLASEIGVRRETIYSYLNFLDNTYFIFFIKPYSKSINSEVRGASKVYFCDTGLLNYLAKISEGVILENAIFNVLKTRGTVNYYQKYKGPEIDFILNKKIGLEVKMKARENDLRKLERTATKLGIKEFYMVSKYFDESDKIILAQDL